MQRGNKKKIIKRSWVTREKKENNVGFLRRRKKNKIAKMSGE